VTADALAGGPGSASGAIVAPILKCIKMPGCFPAMPTRAEFEFNTLLDGFLHTPTYTYFVFLGLLLWRTARRTHLWCRVRCSGTLLMGFGLFNTAEGIINHHVLGLHRSRNRAAGPMALLGPRLPPLGCRDADRQLPALPHDGRNRRASQLNFCFQRTAANVLRRRSHRRNGSFLPEPQSALPVDRKGDQPKQSSQAAGKAPKGAVVEPEVRVENDTGPG
jgi:hypothetical protein